MVNTMKQMLLVFPLAFLVGCTGGTQQIQEQVSAEDSLSEIIEHEIIPVVAWIADRIHT